MNISTLKRERSKIVLGALLLLIFLAGMESILMTVNAKRSTPVAGLRIHSRSISGLGPQEILSVAQGELSTPLQLRYENKLFAIYPRDLGAELNKKGTLNSSYAVGRQGAWWNKVYDQTLSFIGARRIKLSGGISKTLLVVQAIDIESAVNKDATPPMPDFSGDINRTIPAKTGIRVDAKKLAALIEKNIFNPPAQALEIPVQSTSLHHNEAELSPIRAQAIRLTQQPIRIVSAGEIFTLSPDDLKRLLTVVERPDSKNPKIVSLQLRLDEKSLNQKLGEFAINVESKTNAEFDDHDARVAVYSQFFSGKRKLMEIPTGLNKSQEVFTGQNSKGVNISLYINSEPLSQLTRSYLANTAQAAQNSQLPDSAQTSSSKTVYLTFDDGPNAVYHPLILDILKKYQIPATFFLVGENAKRYDEITKRTVQEGYSIGNHSLSHAFLPHLSAEKISKEVQATDEILQSFTGKPITLFRPPYGGVNANVKNESKQDGLKLVLWNVDPRDWSEPDTDTLVNRVISHVHNGSNVLLHSNHLATVKALPKIIDILETQGYQFLSL